MKLSGSLEKNKLADILREVKRDNLTGVLAVKSQEGFGTIHFLNGIIVKAYSPTFKERMGRRLIEKRLISEKDLRKSLMFQKKEAPNTRLGDILLKQGFITEDNLKSTLKEIMEDTLYSMFFWDGIYRFEDEQIDDEEVELSVDVDEFLEEIDRSFSNMEIDFLSEEHDEDMPVKSVPTDQANIKDEIIKSIENVANSISSFSPQELVILVEDEKLMRTIFADGLMNFGYTVESYDNPTEALERINSLELTRVSPVLILDLVMPGIKSTVEIYGGLELLSEINQNLPQIPVIIITSINDTEIRLKSLFMGASYFLNKPDKSHLSSNLLRTGLDQFVEELSLCVENLFRNKRIHNEKEQLAFIREQLISELLDAKLELGSAEREIERDIFDLTYLKKTSKELLRKQSFAFISDTIFNFLKIDHDRGFIAVLKKADMSYYKGFSKKGGDNIEKLNQTSSAFSMGVLELDSFEEVVTKRTFYSGKMSDSDSEKLHKHIGGYLPANCLIIPFVVYDKTVAILYCDDESGTVADKNLDQLQILANAASLAMQITILNEKIARKS
ncbi:MAG: response regulator [Deltaproteobacteria bacterium]|nr:response regulator [Candidatus Zymogenaceae bacterium]